MRKKNFHARLLHSLKISPPFTGAIPPCVQSRRDDMDSIEKLSCELISAEFPPLRQPKPEIVDRGTVRLGESCITAEFPPLRQPKPEIVDRGTVRLGESCITA